MLSLPFLISIAVLIFSYLGVESMRRWALYHHILDIPNERSSHAEATPRGGGLILVIVILGGWWLYSKFQTEFSCPTMGIFTMGALGIAGISWLDDLHKIPPFLRLFFHSLGAVLAVWGVGYWREIYVPLWGSISLEGWGIPLTFFWVVGLTNAYNFMDGIDGIAGGQTLAAGLGWALVGYNFHDPLIGTLGILLMAGSIGFLFHNWHPARIFMGDVGSAFLGYTFAVLPLMFDGIHHEHPAPGLSLWIGALLVWPFIFDTSFTFLRRLIHRENVFAAHRSHLYQRLVIVGYPHWMVTCIYLALALLGLLPAVRLSTQTSVEWIFLLVPIPAFLALWGFVCLEERRIQSSAK